MKNFAKILVFLVSLTLCVSLLCVNVFAEEATGLSGAGTEESPYLINTVDDLILFRDSVNAGETTYNAANVYVALNADLNLAGYDWSVNIGDDCNATFDGIFDGKGHTIYNLTAVETAAKGDGYICSGLFGAIGEGAQVKNFTIENVTIRAPYTGNNVSAVVGFAYNAIGSVENVDVVGHVNINGADASGVGVIVGYAYEGNLTIKDCSVNIADSSTISGINGAAFVGGIIGYASGGTQILNCSVEDIDLSAECAVGGVAGILCDGGVATGNSVKNADLTVTHENWLASAGIVVGTMTDTITVSDIQSNEVTIAGNKAYSIVGSGYAYKPTSPVPAVAGCLNNKYFVDVNDAIAAANDGDTITLCPGNHGTVNVNKAVVLVGATDDDGKNIATVAKLNVTANGATVKNVDVVSESNACYINAADVLIENCNIKGSNGLRNCYTTGLVTLKNCVITGNTYGVHFDGSEGGEIVIDGCTITGWTSFARTINKVTLTNTGFENGNYNYIRFYQKEINISGCTFNENMEIDIHSSVEDSVLNITDSVLENHNDITDLFEANDMGFFDILVDEEKVIPLVQLVKADGTTSYYKVIEKAFENAAAGSVITLLSDATLSATEISINDGNGMETTTAIIVSEGITFDGNNFTLTVLPEEGTNTWASAVYVTGGVLKNITIVGGNRGVLVNRPTADVVIDNVSVSNSLYALNSNAKGVNGEVKLTVTNSTFNGWTSISNASISEVVFENCSFGWSDRGGELQNYAYMRPYGAASFIGCDFAKDYKVDASIVPEISYYNCTVDGEALSPNNAYTLLEGVAVVENNGTIVSYNSFEDAIENVGAGENTIYLIADVTFGYGARTAYGTTETTRLSIDGNGFTLTLDQKDSDWASLGLANPDATLSFNNIIIEKIGYGDTGGAWNTHAIIVTSKLEMTDVTVNQSLCVQKDSVLTNVTINEADGYYGLWITADGQTVTYNGGSITATNGGRGIKIADQYREETAASIILNVSNVTFETAKKAAILVTSNEGADITVSNINIDAVAEDSTNPVWVDEDRSHYFGNVSLNGGYAYVEGGAEAYGAFISINGLAGYYESLVTVFEQANEGDVIALLDNVSLDQTLVILGKVTFDGNGFTLSSVAENAISVASTEEVLVKNLTVANSDGCQVAINIIKEAANLTLSNINATGFKYTVMVDETSCDSKITINDSSLSGFAAIKILGDNTVMTINNTTLTGSNDAALDENNDSAVIVIGDLNSAETIDNVNVSVNGGKILCLSTNGNKQYVLLSENITAAVATIDAELEFIDANVFCGDPKTIQASFRAEYADDLAHQSFICDVVGDGKMVVISFATDYYIGVDGNWYVNGVNTNINAEAVDIVEVRKSEEKSNADMTIYEVVFSNGGIFEIVVEHKQEVVIPEPDVDTDDDEEEKPTIQFTEKSINTFIVVAGAIVLVLGFAAILLIRVKRRSWWNIHS